MTEPRKTKNPYHGALDEAKRHSAWHDGYACGHSDAEMDARDKVVSLTNEFNRNMLHTIDSQAIKISNLVEKNDNQVLIIEGLNESIIKQAGQVACLHCGRPIEMVTMRNSKHTWRHLPSGNIFCIQRNKAAPKETS